MKEHGKVIFYNNVYGKIKSDDGKEYEVFYQNVVDDIKKEDIVEFEKDSIVLENQNINIARYVKTLKRKER